MKKFKNRFENLFICIAVFFFLVGNTTGYAEQTKNEKKTAFEKVELLGMEFQVTEISRTSSNGVKESEDGRMFICVGMDIKNNNNVREYVLSVMNFSLTNENGQWFNVVMPEGTDTVNGIIPAGGNRTGKVYFDVDENTEDFILSFRNRSRMVDDKKLKFHINSEDINIDKAGREHDKSAEENIEKSVEKSEKKAIESVTVNNLKFELLGSKVIDTYDRRAAAEGFKFLSIDLNVENLGDSTEQITSIMTFMLMDEYQNYYRVKLPELDGINTAIKSGEKISGTIVFMVNERSRRINLRCKPWPYQKYHEWIKIK